jgi:hypothetical protein
MLPKLFSTATHFLEQSIATRIALLDKKVVLKNIFIEYNFTKNLIYC